ncbi:porin [Noviherbaspirillum aerium]|uniref:porin n=1 Tax=Noviherbaspirillum aerium TaxID=2588497 RepID=UPI00124C52F0|nr:porin [Noviherbaspirillum aerium]
MKTSLIALAVLGTVAGSSFAQTNVTIYGVADAGLSRIDNGRVNNTALQSGQQSGSRIGFRGTEDLGGGLSAIFTLENGFSIDDGTLGQGGRLFGRQAFVGLQGGFGAVKLGRQYNPIRTAVENIDPFGLGLAGNAANVFSVYGERADNTLNYSSPNFGGFSGQAQYSFGEVAGSTSTGRQVGLSASYSAGPLNIILAHHDQNATAVVAGATVDAGDAKTTFLGGTFDFGVAKLHAAYARSKGETAVGVTNLDRDDAMVGVSAPIGAGTILASYIRRNDDIGGGTRDADQWAIGYTHALSKRTNLYTSYARIKNDAAATVGSPAAAGLDPSVFNVGVRHRF